MFMDTTVILINKGYSGLNPLLIGWENCDPCHHFGPAVRPYWLLHYIFKGEGIFRINGVTHHLSAGEMFVIPPYIETYYEADAEDPWVYSWIGFTCEEALPCPLSATVNCKGLDAIFQRLREVEAMGDGKNAFVAGMIWQIFGIILNNNAPNDRYIERALAYMQAEYMKDISVSGIAAKLGLDRSYFTNIFKKQVGLSPMKYLCDLRLNTAAQLMTVYGESPSTAANSCGYSDIFHFSKAFKKKFGLAPRDYIKINK